MLRARRGSNSRTALVRLNGARSPSRYLTTSLTHGGWSGYSASHGFATPNAAKQSAALVTSSNRKGAKGEPPWLRADRDLHRALVEDLMQLRPAPSRTHAD